MNFFELYEQDLYSAKRCAIYFADRCKLLEQRIEQLEQLCHDLHRGLVYALVCAEVPLEGNEPYQDVKQRMGGLGLLGGEQND